MKIYADESIPYVKQCFKTSDKVITLAIDKIKRENIIDADALLVRTLTKVDRELLEGTNIKFVATNAVGTDHIDLGYLEEKGIGFANAKGCNSNSVAEYVFAALFNLAQEKDFSLDGKTIGVVGVGNIGSVVVNVAQGVGMEVLKNDPPIKRKTGDASFLDLDELMQCDIITLHVPLSYQGIDATHHLFDRKRIFQMKKGAILINTSRGGVVDTEALIKVMDSNHLKAVVIDVWENEPEINLQLLDRATLATPHIAGYSLEGKTRGTYMISKAIGDYFGSCDDWDTSEVMPKPDVPVVEVDAKEKKAEQIINLIIKRVYDIEKDDSLLREILDRPEEDRGDYFIQLRNKYPIRREFHNFHIKLKACSAAIRKSIIALGFRVIQNRPDGLTQCEN